MGELEDLTASVIEQESRHDEGPPVVVCGSGGSVALASRAGGGTLRECTPPRLAWRRRRVVIPQTELDLGLILSDEFRKPTDLQGVAGGFVHIDDGTAEAHRPTSDGKLNGQVVLKT